MPLRVGDFGAKNINKFFKYFGVQKVPYAYRYAQPDFKDIFLVGQKVFCLF
jgi:hypothetical protein